MPPLGSRSRPPRRRLVMTRPRLLALALFWLLALLSGLSGSLGLSTAGPGGDRGAAGGSQLRKLVRPFGSLSPYDHTLKSSATVAANLQQQQQQQRWATPNSLQELSEAANWQLPALIEQFIAEQQQPAVDYPAPSGLVQPIQQAPPPPQVYTQPTQQQPMYTGQSPQQQQPQQQQYVYPPVEPVPFQQLVPPVQTQPQQPPYYQQQQQQQQPVYTQQPVVYQQQLPQQQVVYPQQQQQPVAYPPPQPTLQPMQLAAVPVEQLPPMKPFELQQQQQPPADASEGPASQADHNSKSMFLQQQQQQQQRSLLSLAEQRRATCKLLGDWFGYAVQLFLGAVALVCLFLKWMLEKPPRAGLVFTRDMSKQVVGSLLAHAYNLVFAAYLSEGNTDDPCLCYLANFVVDAIIGMVLCWAMLRLIERLVQSGALGTGPMARALAKSGQYEDWFAYTVQLAQWLLLVTAAKVFLLFTVVVPFKEELYAAGAWSLSIFADSPQAMLVMVMVVIPLVLDIVVFLITDEFIKSPDAETANDLAEQEWLHTHPADSSAAAAVLSGTNPRVTSFADLFCCAPPRSTAGVPNESTPFFRSRSRRSSVSYSEGAVEDLDQLPGSRHQDRNIGHESHENYRSGSDSVFSS